MYNLILSFFIFLQTPIVATSSPLDFLLPLLNNAPAFGILLYFSWKSLKNQEEQSIFLKKQIENETINTKSKEVEIKELNEYMRKNERDNLEILKGSNDVINNLSDNIKTNHETISLKLELSINVLKEHIDNKIEMLNKSIKEH